MNTIAERIKFAMQAKNKKTKYMAMNIYASKGA